jgi:hypothetical protein
MVSFEGGAEPTASISFRRPEIGPDTLSVPDRWSNTWTRGALSGLDRFSAHDERREDALAMPKTVDRPYTVNVALSREEMSWLKELAQIERMTEERVLRRALVRFRKRMLKRQGIRKEIEGARVEVAG